MTGKKKWTPEEILKVSWSFWEACALHAGIKLDIFTLIGDDEVGSHEIAGNLGGSVRGIEMLLNALVSMELLDKKKEQYANTSVGKSFLVKESSNYLGHILMHHHHLMRSWSQLDEAVISGKPLRKRALGDEERESFLMGMFNLAMNIAPDLATRIDLAGRNHLLDLGGGPGTYAIHFCLRNPDLKATVYDLPATMPFAEKTIEKSGLSSRIDFIAGDYLEDEVAGTYDVVWLSHILHAEGPDACQRIVDKAVSVLEPGGLLLLHDFILNDSLDGPQFPALFSLNMLLNTQDGQSYSENQIIEMFRKSGIKDIRRLQFRGPNESGIIAGVC